MPQLPRLGPLDGLFGAVLLKQLDQLGRDATVRRPAFDLASFVSAFRRWRLGHHPASYRTYPHTPPRGRTEAAERGLSGHIHRAAVRNHFARAYVIPA